MAASPEFTSDVMFEILSRTPMTSLDRFKTVSKQINDMAYESSFVPLHGTRTGTVTGYFIQNLESNKNWSKFVSVDGSEEGFLIDFLPFPVKILASSNQGILCCYGEIWPNQKFYICKPCTRQWEVLPSPKMRYHTKKVAIVVLKSRPLRYKIIRIGESRPKRINYNNYRCEVFDSDTWTWRELNQILLPPTVFFNNEPGVVSSVAYGVVHWLLSNNQILAFYLGKEIYEILDPPMTITFDTGGYFTHKQVLACKGKLAFFCKDPAGYLLLWEMQNHRNRLWGQMETLRIKPVEEKEAYYTCPAFYNAGIALLTGNFRVKFYNFQDASSREVKMPNDICRAEIFPFRSDREPVELSRFR